MLHFAQLLVIAVFKIIQTWGGELTLIRNMLLLKNPQFLPNNYETLLK